MKQDTTQKMILDWQNKKPLVEGLPPDLVFPGYGGYSLSNLSASICRWLGAPLQRLPLDPVYHQPFSDRYRHILLFVCDGLGLNMLQKTMLGEGEIFNSNEKEELFNDAYLYPLTSVTPSTTSAALTSLWTGALPYEHGIVGYEIWLKEYGMITNMIRQTAASFSGDWGGLARAGFDAEQFLPIKSISALLSEQQVQTHFYIDSHLVQSGLTVMHMPGAKIHAFSP